MTYRKRFDEMTSDEQWFLAAIIGKDMQEVLAGTDPDTHELTVQVIVNGVEVNVPKWVDRVTSSFSDAVDREAVAVVSKKFAEMYEGIEGITDAIRAYERELRNKYNIPETDSWDY